MVFIQQTGVDRSYDQLDTRIEYDLLFASYSPVLSHETVVMESRADGCINSRFTNAHFSSRLMDLLLSVSNHQLFILLLAGFHLDQTNDDATAIIRQFTVIIENYTEMAVKYFYSGLR